MERGRGDVMTGFSGIPGMIVRCAIVCPPFTDRGLWAGVVVWGGGAHSLERMGVEWRRCTTTCS